MIATVVAFLICAAWFAVLIRTARGLPALPDLPRGLPLPDKPPLVSVIVAAKEEQDNIQETIKHLMRQSYPRLEIVAVNDRSNDATGARLEELKAWSESRPNDGPPLRVVHITQLPDGWLGKNHAMYQGYRLARGSFLLFTDADVLFQPDAIRDAVAYALRESAEHITLLPRLKSRSFLLKAFVHYFMFCLCLIYPPWLANRDDLRRGGIGVGAFNLIRRDAYEAIGTHEALRMRPDDDLRLGALVKKAGLRQRVVPGADRIGVEWYKSLKEAIKGLEKNIYAGLGYRVSLAVSAVAGQLLFFVLPLFAPLWARGAAFWLFLLADLLFALTYLAVVRRINGERGEDVLALHAAVPVLVWVLTRSIWLAHKRKGVYWRGTFYALNELKRRFR